jgi:6-phosphogluconolactonase
MKYILIVLYFVLSVQHLHAQREILYAGTFSVRGSEGIYVFNFDRKLKKLEQIQTVSTPESPSFIALHPTGRFLYSVNRGNSQALTNSGSISAFSIDPSNGKLSPLNEQISYGSGPCHVSTDATGKLLFVSHYNEGTLMVFNISENGAVGALTDSIRYTGHSINQQRQEKPHIHAAIISPDNRFLFVTDLGTDRIYCFQFNTSTGKLTPAEQPYTEVKAGSGPRHFTFHPNEKYAYLVEELTSSICAFSYDKHSGKLNILKDQITSLPPDFKVTNSSADIHIDPSGKYLMMSNRGQDALVIFSIAKDGSLRQLGTINTNGKKPRNFLIDPKNNFVMVAHQDSDDIAIFNWNRKKGKLAFQGLVKVPSPVSLQFLKLE